MNPKLKLRVRNAGMGLLAFVLALAIWLPCLHFFFRKPLEDFYQENGISPKARQLAARHLLLWTDSTLRQAELKKMQKFAVAIPWFGALMLAEGCILLFHGLRIALPPFPFYGDTAACFLGGAGILYLSTNWRGPRFRF